MALQLLQRLSTSERDWDREQSAGDHLPYLAQIDDNTLLLRNGRLMQVIALDGLLFDTAETADVNYRKALRDAMLQAVGSSRFALYHHTVRRRIGPDLAGNSDACSANLDHNKATGCKHSGDKGISPLALQNGEGQHCSHKQVGESQCFGRQLR